MSNASWLIPVWILGAPAVAIILSSLFGRGSSSMGGSSSTAYSPRM